jgi:hypothetical protein
MVEKILVIEAGARLGSEADGHTTEASLDR